MATFKELQEATKRYNDKNPDKKVTFPGWSLFFGILMLVAFMYMDGCFDSSDKKPAYEQTVPVKPAITPAGTFPADTLAFITAGQVLCKQAITLQAKDPESVKFLEQTVETIYPNANKYGGKWLITATNSFGGREQAYGVAMVHFNGGDVRDCVNWEVTTASIIDAQ